jgi:ArsR family transcriptional regulator
MRKGIPKEIAGEISCLGGIDGIRNKIPGKRFLHKLAKRHEVLSDPVRLQVLLTLRHGTLCVCVLREVTGCPDTRLSYHLSTLRRAGLIGSKRDRSFLRYFLTPNGRSITSGIFSNRG